MTNLPDSAKVAAREGSVQIQCLRMIQNHVFLPTLTLNYPLSGDVNGQISVTCLAIWSGVSNSPETLRGNIDPSHSPF